MTQQTAVELVAWQPNGSMQPFALRANHSVLVGKSSNCGLQLTGHGISDIHCRIGFEGGHLWVQDWMSATGTKVNGERVTAKTQVGQGSVIEIGGYRIQISKADRARLEAEARAVLAQPVAPACNSATAAAPGAVPAPAAQPTTAASARSPQPASAERPTAAKPMQHPPANRDKSKESACPAETKRGKDASVSEASFFSDDDGLVDRETVELLLAEIEDLRTALAQRDSDHLHSAPAPTPAPVDEDESEKMLHRMQELIDEANRADERVMLLEEMLHAAEDANRSEIEERAHLEAWVGDIEKRIGQREEEHAAELDALRSRLDSADERYSRLQRELQQTASTGDNASKRYEETMEQLQQDNRQLQDCLADAQKDLRQLMQKYENQAEQSEAALREERAKIAREHAEMSRLKFEYAQKLRELEAIPKSEAEVDPRLKNLQEHRQYLREMSVEKKERQQHSLSSRLKRIWSLVE